MTVQMSTKLTTKRTKKMRKLLFLLSMMLLFVNVRAQTVISIEVPPSVTFKANQNYPTTVGLNFTTLTPYANRDVNFKVQLMYFPLTGNPEVVTETSVNKMSHYDPTELSWKFQLIGSLQAGKTKGKIGLKVVRFLPSGEQTEISSTQYSLVDITPPPPSTNVNEGEMLRITENGMIYFGMDAKWRHIQDGNTLAGVFIKNPTIIPISQASFNSRYEASKIGSPIGPNTRIVEDTNNGQIYYQEDGVLRYISSPAAANKYKFDLKKAQKIHGTGGYTFGSTFN